MPSVGRKTLSSSCSSLVDGITGTCLCCSKMRIYILRGDASEVQPATRRLQHRFPRERVVEQRAVVERHERRRPLAAPSIRLVPLGDCTRYHIPLLLIVSERFRQPRPTHFMGFVRFDFVDVYTERFHFLGSFEVVGLLDSELG